MRRLAWFTLLCVAPCAAFAQLDEILAPLPSARILAQPKEIASQADSDTGAPLVAKTPRVLSGDDVLRVLEKQLSAYFSLKGDLKLGLVRDWKPMKLPADDFDIAITDYPPEGVTSSFLIRCKISSGGQPVGEWQLPLRAQLWQEVWVSQGRLERGQALDRSALNVQKVDALHDKQTFLDTEADPAAYDVVQGLAAGRPISKHDVIERPLIHKGDVVEVVALQGALSIRMKALALESGGSNDLIKMRNLDSLKVFNAQIINENQVKVHF